MANTIIGRVLATEKNPTTIDNNKFVSQTIQRIYNGAVFIIINR